MTSLTPHLFFSHAFAFFSIFCMLAFFSCPITPGANIGHGFSCHWDSFWLWFLLIGGLCFTLAQREWSPLQEQGGGVGGLFGSQHWIVCNPSLAHPCANVHPYIVLVTEVQQMLFFNGYICISALVVHCFCFSHKTFCTAFLKCFYWNYFPAIFSKLLCVAIWIIAFWKECTNSKNHIFLKYDVERREKFLHFSLFLAHRICFVLCSSHDKKAM